VKITAIHAAGREIMVFIQDNDVEFTRSAMAQP